MHLSLHRSLHRSLHLSTHRLVIATCVAATAVALPVTALATSGGPKAAPKPVTPATAAAATPTKASPSNAVAAGRADGISEGRTQAGLVAAKEQGGNTPAGVRAFASAAQVPQATAQALVDKAFGTTSDHGFVTANTVAAMASRLGVSQDAARAALTAVVALSGKDGVDPSSQAFTAIAHGLGVTAQQLAAALDAAKEAAAG